MAHMKEVAERIAVHGRSGKGKIESRKKENEKRYKKRKARLSASKAALFENDAALGAIASAPVAIVESE